MLQCDDVYEPLTWTQRQVFYLYYRAGIMLGVWLAFGVREFLELFWTVALMVSSCKADPTSLRRLMDFGWGACGRFLETLGCVAFMNLIFWFSCNIFWKANFSYAVEFYLWGFVNDFFGDCAASGYKDVYGWDCLPPTQIFSETAIDAALTVLGLLLAGPAGAFGLAALATAAAAVAGLALNFHRQSNLVNPSPQRGL